MFYAIFTNLCNVKGLSPTATLKILDISTSKLTAWKNGSLPSASVLILLSEFFGVTIDYLLTGEDHVLAIPQNNGIQQTDGRECELLKYFRCLPTDEKDKLIGRAQLLAEQVSIEENAG